jgi:hypothetical protein
MKVATFIEVIFNFHNIKKKKFEKLSAAAVFPAAKKGVQKRQHFS